MMDQVIPQPSQLPAEHTLHAAMSFSGRRIETVQVQIPIHLQGQKGAHFGVSSLPSAVIGLKQWIIILES